MKHCYESIVLVAYSLLRYQVSKTHDLNEDKITCYKNA